MSRRLGMGLVGPGFVAARHIDAVRRLGDVDVIAVAGSSLESARRKADIWHVDRAYGRYEELIGDGDVHVVHNTTPNRLHFEVTLAALRAGKHVIADKPLACTVEECRVLRDAARSAGVAHAVTFTYRGNPLVQQARALVAGGEIGRVRFVRGHYLQDWLADPNVYSWRLDPERGGASSALADIGSHWCDLVEHMSGARIESVLADLSTLVPVRYRASEAETFGAASAPGESRAVREPQREAIKISVEDSASILLRLAGGVRGSFCVAQVLPGHKNDLEVEVCGTKMSLRWQQERQGELWVGHLAEPSQLLGENRHYARDVAQRYMRLPEGHRLGWSDALFNVIADAYEWIRLGAVRDTKPPALPTFEDGHRSACIVDAMIRSHAAGAVWQHIG